MGHVVVVDPTVHRKFNEIENIFDFAASRDYVSPAYESRTCLCCPDPYGGWDAGTNSIITIDFYRYTIVGKTALVNEWWFGDCEPCLVDYFVPDWEDWQIWKEEYYDEIWYYYYIVGSKYCELPDGYEIFP